MLCGFTFPCDILWRTGALEAAVDGHGLFAAGGAERVPRVPVEKLARFGIDGG